MQLFTDHQITASSLNSFSAQTYVYVNGPKIPLKFEFHMQKAKSVKTSEKKYDRTTFIQPK
jgi:hypothetical protein